MKWLTANVMYLNEAINIINFVSDVLIWPLSYGTEGYSVIARYTCVGVFKKHLFEISY